MLRVLVDTSVLVRLRDRDSPHLATCERALRLLVDSNGEACLCAQVLIEFWSAATRPVEANGLGRSTEEAYLDCHRFQQTMSLLPEPPDIAERWLRIVRQYAVQGKEVHDARLVAFAVAHRLADILTLNPDDFHRYREVTTWTPGQLMEHIAHGG